MVHESFKPKINLIRHNDQRGLGPTYRFPQCSDSVSTQVYSSMRHGKNRFLTHFFLRKRRLGRQTCHWHHQNSSRNYHPSSSSSLVPLAKTVLVVRIPVSVVVVVVFVMAGRGWRSVVARTHGRLRRRRTAGLGPILATNDESQHWSRGLGRRPQTDGWLRTHRASTLK